MSLEPALEPMPFDWRDPRATGPDGIGSLKGVPFIAKLMMKVASRIQIGALGAVLPDGRKVAFHGKEAGPEGVVILKDYKTLHRIATGGSLGFAEAYLDGHWDSPDVTAVLECAVVNAPKFEEFYSAGAVTRAINRLIHLLRPNTRRGAQKNIHAHYDLGNAFYDKWLDETMTYSSALYRSGANSLADAQTAKYRALADQIELKPGDHVLEIGCGWGGFAEYAARERGARVTGLTISKEQLAFAQARMQRAGLSDRVEIRFQDYRDVTETFDKVASIEMFEAVGEKYWPVYFGKIGEVLKPGGAAGLQIITIEDESFEGYRSRVDFIQKYVFPGGMLPSLAALKRQADKARLAWQGHVPFGRDYARTLAEWRTRFLSAWNEIRAMGFDERFRRLWTYYLSYCEAGFKGGSIDVVQLRLGKA